MKLDKLASIIDELGAKAYKRKKKNLEQFFAVLGAKFAESIFLKSNQTKRAIWLFDLAPNIMYDQIKEYLSVLKIEEQKEAIKDLTLLINEEQRIGRQSPERADLIRRIFNQVEEQLK